MFQYSNIFFIILTYTTICKSRDINLGKSSRYQIHTSQLLLYAIINKPKMYGLICRLDATWFGYQNHLKIGSSPAIHQVQFSCERNCLKVKCQF